MKKKILLIVLSIVGVLGLAFVLVLGYLGYIPGLSALLGANKPRDLGITYTEADLKSARAKSKIVYGELPAETPVLESVQYIGSREVNQTFSSEEITASMNNQTYKYWPFEQVQVKFNGDGSGEISGILNKEKARGFFTFIDFPQVVIDTAMRFLPPDPAFYVKGKAALKDNKVSVFEPQSFSIGKISLPVGMFLSMAPAIEMPVAYADSITDLSAELDKAQNKREWIIAYINQRIAVTTGFSAEDAHFSEDGLVFKGTLTKEIKSVQ